MNTGRTIFILAISTFAFTLSLPSISSANEGLHTNLHGTFVFAGGSAERVARDRSIDAVVGRMNVIMRPFASNKLREICVIPSRLVVQAQHDRVGIALQPLPERVSTVDGRVNRYTSIIGRQAAIRRVVRGNTLVETVTTSRGQRVINYRLSNDGSILRLRWSLSSQQYLPTPVTYSLTYRRAS